MTCVTRVVILALSPALVPCVCAAQTGLTELPIEWILDDFPYYSGNAGGSLPSPEAVFQVYKDEFDVAYQEGTMLILTTHPHVSGHRSRIVQLEKLIA